MSCGEGGRGDAVLRASGKGERESARGERTARLAACSRRAHARTCPEASLEKDRVSCV